QKFRQDSPVVRALSICEMLQMGNVAACETGRVSFCTARDDFHILFKKRLELEEPVPLHVYGVHPRMAHIEVASLRFKAQFGFALRVVFFLVCIVANACYGFPPALDDDLVSSSTAVFVSPDTGDDGGADTQNTDFNFHTQFGITVSIILPAGDSTEVLLPPR